LLTKNLLRYYFECLKFESHYSVQLKQHEVAESTFHPKNIDEVTKKYEALSKSLKDEQTIMFGYPLVKKVQDHQTSYIPLLLWSNTTFISDREIFKADQYGLHQELYRFAADKRSIEALNEWKEKFALSPKSFLKDEQNVVELIGCTEYEAKDIIHRFVLVLANNKNSLNYLIVNEIQSILENKYQPSVLLSSFLTHSFALPVSHSRRTFLHIVPGNYPQNLAISNILNSVNLIKGPPGTGKTQTILNLIATQVAQQETCVVASTNNQAVDNIVEKFVDKGISQKFFGYVRLGNLGHNKTESVKIRNAIERMKNEIQTIIPDNILKDYLGKSQLLMDQIQEAEAAEQQIIDLTKTIDQLGSLIGVLNDRLQLLHLTTMKHDFSELAVANEQVEERLRKIIDEPLRLFGNGNFRNFRSFIAKKVAVYMKWQVKSCLRKIDASKLWEYIDISSPIQSLALCEEIVKIINLEKRLEQYKLQLLYLQNQQYGIPHSLQELYDDKNKIDMLIVRSLWLRKAKVILTNVSEMRNIESLLRELTQDGKIRQTAFAFGSFLKLFPVLLVSSLSARNCIPLGASLDLAIIDESS